MRRSPFAQVGGVIVGPLANIALGHDCQRGDARGGRHGIGVKRPLVNDLLATRLGRSLVIEPVENIAAAADRASRQPAGQDFGECGQVGRNAEATLCTAG